MKQKRLLRKSAFLAILIHLLFLLSIAIVLTPPKKSMPFIQEKVFVPAYVYKGSIKPTLTKVREQQTQKTTPIDESPFAIKKSTAHQSILAMTEAVMQQEQLEKATQTKGDEEPMLLIGDDSSIADPLVKAIGRSLSAHFSYPDMEGRFGITGKVILRLIIHPEGFFSDVMIVRSSNNQNFDNAALYAVNTAPKVIGIEKLLPKAKPILVGFIFN